MLLDPRDHAIAVKEIAHALLTAAMNLQVAQENWQNEPRTLELQHAFIVSAALVSSCIDDLVSLQHELDLYRLNSYGKVSRLETKYGNT